MDSRNDPVEYWLDERDVIVEVNEAFRAFAEANGAPGLSDRAIGTPIWDYLKGYEIQEIYRAIFEDVRRAGDVSRFRLQCDGAATRVHLQMELRSVAAGGLHVRSTVLGIEARPDAIPMLEAAVPGRLVRGCAFCSRINGPPWMPAREAAEKLHLMADGALRITHGVCPECSERILGEVQAKLAGL